MLKILKVTKIEGSKGCKKFVSSFVERFNRLDLFLHCTVKQRVL